MDCLFCNIAAGNIPSKKIYETETVYAFADIDPQAPFHCILIPRQHLASAAEITKENNAVIGEIYEAAAEIARQQGLTNGFRIVTNCGRDGGQTVGHLHFHMLAGRLLSWPPG